MAGMPVKVDGANFALPADVVWAGASAVTLTNGDTNGVLASGSADGVSAVAVRLTALASSADVRLQVSEDGVNNWINTPVEYPGFTSGQINLLD